MKATEMDVAVDGQKMMLAVAIMLGVLMTYEMLTMVDG